MNHPELFLLRFGCHHLKRNFLEIIPEEHNSLVDIRVHRGPVPINELDPAPLDDVK